MNKQEFIEKYNLTQAVFTAENTRKNVSKKEFATLKALCKTQTLGLTLDVDDTVNTDALNVAVDYKLAHRGNAHDGSLISIWSRNAQTHSTKKADYRDYGVRIHVATFERYADVAEFTQLTADMATQIFSHRNGYEVRYTFKTLADAVKFVFDVADAVKSIETAETDADSTAETAESESETA